MELEDVRQKDRQVISVHSDYPVLNRLKSLTVDLDAVGRDHYMRDAYISTTPNDTRSGFAA